MTEKQCRLIRLELILERIERKLDQYFAEHGVRAAERVPEPSFERGP